MKRTGVPPRRNLPGQLSSTAVIIEVLSSENVLINTVSAVLGGRLGTVSLSSSAHAHAHSFAFSLHDHLRFKPFRKCIRLGGRWQTVFSSPKSLTTEANLAVWAVNFVSRSC